MLKDKRLMNLAELMEYIGLGRTNALKWGRENEVVVHIGRRVFYDRKRVDDVLDSLSEKAQ